MASCRRGTTCEQRRSPAPDGLLTFVRPLCRPGGDTKLQALQDCVLVLLYDWIWRQVELDGTLLLLQFGKHTEVCVCGCGRCSEPVVPRLRRG